MAYLVIVPTPVFAAERAFGAGGLDHVVDLALGHADPPQRGIGAHRLRPATSAATRRRFARLFVTRSAAWFVLAETMS